MDWPFSPLPMFGFDAVVVDPPWDYDLYSAKGQGKSQHAHYDVMSDEEILNLPVGLLVGADSWLLLWTVAPKLPLGVKCLDAWGFRYVTTVAWRKVFVSGKPAMGPGYVARTLHENVLVGAAGRPQHRKALPSLFEGVRREHSRKPDEFYALIDGFLPAHYRRADIFSRQSRPGWSGWGREATKFDPEAA